MHRVKRPLIFCVATVALACSAAFAANPGAARPSGAKPEPVPFVDDGKIGQYALAWADEFEGDALNNDYWFHRTDSKHWSVQLPQNVAVNGGMLRLRLTKLDKPEARKTADPDPKRSGVVKEMKYGGAGVITKRAFKHGFYEARFKCPAGAGWHNSFWMMNHNGNGDTLPTTAAQEIDVCEHDSVKQTGFAANLHQWKPKHKQFGAWGTKTPDLSADFHVFGCEYTPTKIRFFFDGKEFASTDKIATFENNEQHIWLTSIATHLGGAKEVDESKLPAEMTVDWVRFYEPKAVAESK